MMQHIPGAAVGVVIVLSASAPGDIWTDMPRFTRTAPESREGTGYGVALHGDRVLVGAPRAADVAAQAGAVLELTLVDGAWAETGTVVPPALSPGDRFGTALAVDGDVLVVGAPMDDDLGPEAGAAYVFRRVAGAWTFESKLTAPDGGPRHHMGWSVDVSGDRVIAGAPRYDGEILEGGAAYVYRHVDGAWLWESSLYVDDVAPIAAPESWFGDRVVIEGPYALVGAPRSQVCGWNDGTVHPYRLDGGAWVAEDVLCPQTSGSHEWFGDGMAIDGGTLVIGADGAGGAGRAWVYAREGASWSVAQSISPVGLQSQAAFGDTVALAGDLLAIGAPRQGPPRYGGAVVTFERVEGTWIQSQILESPDTVADDGFGRALAVGAETLAVGSGNGDIGALQNGGAVDLFERAPGRLPASQRLMTRMVEEPHLFPMPMSEGYGSGAHARGGAPIEGYTDALSYGVGDVIDLHVSCVTPTFDLEIYREVEFGEATVHAVSDIPAIVQDMPDDGWLGADWDVTISVPVGDWPTGTYAARFTNENGDEHHHPFVIRPTVPGATSRVLFLANFNNRNAYNEWGGKSIYGSSFFSDPEPARRVSFLRPIDGGEGRGRDWSWVRRMHAYLSEMGYAFEHLTEHDIDRDPCLLQHYDVVILSGHHEYPTSRAYDALQAHHDRGGHIMNMSADGMTWQVRFEDNGGTMVCYRGAADDDPIHDVRPCLLTTKWHEPPLNRPPELLRGTRLQDDSNLVGTDEYIVQDASHWFFTGTSAQNGLPFGFEMARSEQDWITVDSPQVDILLYALKADHHPSKTASAIDMISVGATWFEDTAEYGFPDGNGGMVFTAGTVRGWTAGMNLDDPGGDEVRRATANVLDRMLAQPAPPADPDCWVDPWCANGPDIDGDGGVGTGDLLAILASWGPCWGCLADLDLDGQVGTSDLLIILAAWTG